MRGPTNRRQGGCGPHPTEQCDEGAANDGDNTGNIVKAFLLLRILVYCAPADNRRIQRRGVKREVDVDDQTQECQTSKAESSYDGKYRSDIEYWIALEVAPHLLQGNYHVCGHPVFEAEARSAATVFVVEIPVDKTNSQRTSAIIVAKGVSAHDGLAEIVLRSAYFAFDNPNLLETKIRILPSWRRSNTPAAAITSAYRIQNHRS